MSKKVIGQFDPVPVGESLSYGLGSLGTCLLTVVLMSYLSWFYTDFAGMPIAFVGAMMAVCKVFDGFTDIAMGIIVDRTKSKMGKCRPWLIRMAIPTAVLLVLLFTVPANAGMGAKMAYCAVTYVMTTSICMTMVSIPVQSLMARITRHPKSLNTLGGMSLAFSKGTALLVGVVHVPLLIKLGYNQRAFIILFVFYGLIAMIGMFIAGACTRERVTEIGVEYASNAPKQPKVGLLKQLKCLFTNKFWVIAILAYCGYSMLSGVGGVYMYFFQDVMGNSGYMSYFSIAENVPAIIGGFLFPLFIHKIGKRRAFICLMMTLSLVRYIVQWIFPTALGGNLAMWFIASFGSTAYETVMFVMIAEAIDYGELKQGVRAEGLSYSFCSFAMKVMAAITSAIISAIMASSGYDGMAAVQPDSAINAIMFGKCGMGIISHVLVIFFMLLFTLGPKMPQIRAELAERRAKQQAAAGQVEG